MKPGEGEWLIIFIATLGNGLGTMEGGWLFMLLPRIDSKADFMVADKLSPLLLMI